MTTEQLIKSYERYLLKCATSFNQDKYKDDLIQEGRIAIADAYEKYDESMGKLHPYLISYINGRMKTFLSKNARTIRIPMTHFNNGPYSNKDFFEMKKVSMIVTNEEGNQVERDFEDDFEDETPDDQEYFKSLRLTNSINKLKPLYKELITMRYIEDMTYQAIGKKLEITKEGARQLVQAAMNKLKKIMAP